MRYLIENFSVFSEAFAVARQLASVHGEKAIGNGLSLASLLPLLEAMQRDLLSATPVNGALEVSADVANELRTVLPFLIRLLREENDDLNADLLLSAHNKLGLWVPGMEENDPKPYVGLLNILERPEAPTPPAGAGHTIWSGRDGTRGPSFGGFSGATAWNLLEADNFLSAGDAPGAAYCAEHLEGSTHGGAADVHAHLLDTLASLWDSADIAGTHMKGWPIEPSKSVRIPDPAQFAEDLGIALETMRQSGHLDRKGKLKSVIERFQPESNEPCEFGENDFAPFATIEEFGHALNNALNSHPELIGASTENRADHPVQIVRRRCWSLLQMPLRLRPFLGLMALQAERGRDSIRHWPTPSFSIGGHRGVTEPRIDTNSSPPALSSGGDKDSVAGESDEKPSAET